MLKNYLSHVYISFINKPHLDSTSFLSMIDCFYPVFLDFMIYFFM